MNDRKNKLLKDYLPLINKEVARFSKTSDISRDELLSEAYFIFARAIYKGKDRMPGFPLYIKKSIHFGLLRYVIRERKRRKRYEYR